MTIKHGDNSNADTPVYPYKQIKKATENLCSPSLYINLAVINYFFKDSSALP